MKAKNVVVLAATLLLPVSQLQANPLNLAPAGPDFFANYLNVSYDSGSGVFNAEGWTELYTDGSVEMIADYEDMSFVLTANIDTSGYLSSGSVTIMGDLGLGDGNEELLKGDLNVGHDGTAFGSYSPTGRFEFLFTVTGLNSVIVSDFGGLGATSCGIIMHLGGTEFWDGSWESSFQNDYQGVADTFVVPEPSSFLILVCGGVLWATANRRR